MDWDDDVILLYLTFYTSTQLTAALSTQEVKGRQMGKSRHLAFSGQVSVSAGGIYCGYLKWTQVAIAFHKRDHCGSESTSVWTELYGMAVFGSVDTAMLIVMEVCERRVEQPHEKSVEENGCWYSQLNPEDSEVICPITYTWLTFTGLTTPKTVNTLNPFLTYVNTLWLRNLILYKCYCNTPFIIFYKHIVLFLKCISKPFVFAAKQNGASIHKRTYFTTFCKTFLFQVSLRGFHSIFQERFHQQSRRHN